MSHLKLKKDWKMPNFPKGCNRVAVNVGQSGNVKISYAKVKLKKDGSIGSVLNIYDVDENKGIPRVVWPWMPDYTPSFQDWKSIGFEPFRMFDSCFGSPNPNYMFLDWIEKDI